MQNERGTYDTRRGREGERREKERVGVENSTRIWSASLDNKCMVTTDSPTKPKSDTISLFSLPMRLGHSK